MDLLQRVGLLPHRGGERVQPDRAAAEAVHDRLEDPPVHLVEPLLVDVEQGERLAREVARDPAVGAHLGVVAHAAQEPVGDARACRGCAATSRAARRVRSSTSRRRAERSRMRARCSAA